MVAVLSSFPTLETFGDRTVTLLFTESCSNGELEVAYAVVLEGLGYSDKQDSTSTQHDHL